MFIFFSAMILALALRGLPGNPTAEELSSPNWVSTGPFESSGERGKFALTYSYIEDGTTHFSLPIAGFATPDLAVTKTGQYVSLFAPATAFITMPGYIVGKYFGVSQLGVFSVIALFAFLNILLIRGIAILIGANPIAAGIGAFMFAFATPAFTYGVTLSQHHISTFIILLGIYALLKWNNYWSLALIWFLTALSISVDNPNIFFMLPIAIYALGRIFIFQNTENKFKIRIKILGFLSFAAMIAPILFFLWFNSVSNGSPFQISGTLERAVSIDEKSESIEAKAEKELMNEGMISPKKEKTAVGSLKTRNLTNGFYIHFLSPDRGIINYAPIVLFGILGLAYLYRKKYYYANLIVVIIGFNVLLYSMWGDPYGGWSFGSRYLIPTYAMLGIGIGIFLTHWKKNTAILIIFFAVFIYSARVNTLGALTSNTNPPRVEVLALEQLTHKEQKYTYERNQQYLEEKGSKSFLFQAYLKNKISAQEYYQIVSGLIIAVSLALVLSLRAADLDLSKILFMIKRK